MPAREVARLRSKGHDVEVGANYVIPTGGAQLIRVLDSGVRACGSDPRKDGCALAQQDVRARRESGPEGRGRRGGRSSYVVLSLAVAPFAFGPLQFRLGEVLKPLVIKYPATIPAFAVGVAIVNLFSLLAGALELALMPAVNLLGGALCWLVARRIGVRSGPTWPAFSSR